MSDDRNGFMSRWSRRKRTIREKTGPAVPDERQTAMPEDFAGTPETPSAETVADLPDIEALDENSDFSAFMREGVPDALRRQALRRLWRLNPVFANLDGLNDYDEDFTSAATVVKGLKTAYRVGRGFLDEVAEEKDAAAEGGESTRPTQLAEAAETIPSPPVSTDHGMPSDQSMPPPTESSAARRIAEGAEVKDSQSEAIADHVAERPPESNRKKKTTRRSARLRRWGDSRP